MVDRPYHYDLPAVRDCDSEIAIQKAIRNRIAAQFRNTISFAVPNGTNITSIAGRARAKREGLVKGVCDLIIVGKMERLYTVPLVAFCEIKAGSSLSPEQDAFLTKMASMGHHAGVFRSQETIVAKLLEWNFS